MTYLSLKSVHESGLDWTIVLLNLPNNLQKWSVTLRGSEPHLTFDFWATRVRHQTASLSVIAWTAAVFQCCLWAGQPSKLSLPMGYRNPRLIHSFSPPEEAPPQMKSRSVQSFLQGSDTQTDHVTASVAIGRYR